MNDQAGKDAPIVITQSFFHWGLANLKLWLTTMVFIDASLLEYVGHVLVKKFKLALRKMVNIESNEIVFFWADTKDVSIFFSFANHFLWCREYRVSNLEVSSFREDFGLIERLEDVLVLKRHQLEVRWIEWGHLGLRYNGAQVDFQWSSLHL